MVIHVLVQVRQEQARNDRHRPKPDTRQVHILITLCIRHPARGHHHLVRCLVVPNAGDEFEFLEERRTGQTDCFFDEVWVGNVKVDGHCATDVVDSVGYELGDEDVVVDCVADGAADYADGEGECGDGGDQVVWADDCRDDRGGHDDAADAEAGKDEKTPESVEIVDASAGKGAAAWKRFVREVPVQGVGLCDLPAVMMMLLAIINSLFLPRRALRRYKTTQAPVRMEKPIGIPRIPTPTGS